MHLHKLLKTCLATGESHFLNETAALYRKSVELFPVVQNLSIDVHQNIISFLNKFFPIPFIRNPSSRIHQSDVLLFKRHLLCAVN